MSTHIRGGANAPRPYLFCKLDMIDFVQDVFGAKIVARYDQPGGAHVEAQIEDSLLVVECSDGFAEHIETPVGSAYLYVPDVIAVYAKAMEAGATSISPPEDKPYDERQCGIKDSFGNTWWISTYTGE